jgi:hypothetical protein
VGIGAASLSAVVRSFWACKATRALFERGYTEPLAFQLEYARRHSHYATPYPDIAT